MRRGREKGKSHPTRPILVNEGLIKNFDPETVKNLIIELAKKGTPPSQIGIILRDQYGVPLVKHVLGKKITQVLEENNLKPSIPEDLSNLIKKAQRILNHLKEHPSDFKSKRGLEETISKINRLVKYYKRENVLPQDWSFEISLPK